MDRAFWSGGLFWTWQDASWKRAALLGLLAGVIYFSLDYAWVGNTVSHYIGAFGTSSGRAQRFRSALFRHCGRAGGDRVARARPALAPLAAAAFTAGEWMRSFGVVGAPRDSAAADDSPLRAIAAFAGRTASRLRSAYSARSADAIHRRTWRPLRLVAAGAHRAASGAWPARTLAAAGNARGRDSREHPAVIKATDLPPAVRRYTAMTRQAVAHHPTLIVWPETVITDMTPTRPGAAFGALARAGNGTIVAGGQESAGRRIITRLYLRPTDRSRTIANANSFRLLNSPVRSFSVAAVRRQFELAYGKWNG